MADKKYNKDGEFKFAEMKIEELRELFSEMEQTAIDLALVKSVAAIPAEATQKDAAEACENLHNFIRVRTTEAKVDNAEAKKKKQAAKKPAAKTKAEGNPAKATSKQEKDTMATKKSKTAKKTASKKKAVANARTSYKPDAKITFLKDENPARKGTGRYDRVEKLRKFHGKTVEAYLKAGGKVGVIKRSVEAKWAKVG